MATTFVVITVTALLMVLSSGSGEPEPSMTLSHRAGSLWLHISGSVVRPLQCYSDATPHLLPIIQLSSNEYLVVVEHAGQYWCEDSSGVHSNTYHKRKRRSLLLAPIPESVSSQWNPDEEESTLIDWWNVGHSDGQKPTVGGSVNGNAVDITHSDKLRQMTGSTVLLTKYNRTCPAQTQKDENGVERYWPEMELDSTHIYSNGKCVEAARTCTWSPSMGLHLIAPHTGDFHTLPLCSIKNVNLTWAVHDVQNIAQKDVISATDLEAAIRVVNQALQVNYSILSMARQDVSSIVRGLDAVLTRVQVAPGESVKYVTPHVAIFVLNVEQQPPVAVALESSGGNGELEESSLHTISSEQEIFSSKLDVAVLLPHSLTAQSSHIALAIFNDDRAFQDPVYKANSRIVSINVVGAPKLQDEQYVDIVFRPWAEMGNRSCAFWDFNLSGGAWSVKGCELMPSARTMHDVCRCSHLTHFAEIISPPGVEMDPIHRDLLDIISIVGCSLSLVGLLGIFFTGAAFWQWREQLGNKILLHLSAAVSLNMLVFLITAIRLLHTNYMCIMLGVILHYSVLASFCWMLVSAGLQFMRLVTVFGSQHIPHLLLKASVFAWGAPLIPVIVLLAVDSQLYVRDGREFCYPGGLAFYLAVLCPVLMIVTVNLIVFGMIMRHLFRGSVIKRHVQSGRKLAMRRVATSVLLFFLLGLSWVFGLLAGISTLCAYLFCITATLQGLVLFLFFVLGEKKSRDYWTHSSATHNRTTSTTSTPAERVALRMRDETTQL